jgi:tetratricopeptide (TPR) repeat protein
MGAFIVLICITALCLWLWKRQKIFLLIWIYYGITLLPVLGIIQVGAQAAADRYTYLPSLGPFLLTGFGISLFCEKTLMPINREILKRLYALMILLLLFVPLSIVTINQIKIWEDSLTLWNAELRTYPDSFMAYRGRGVAYLNRGILQQSIRDFSKAIELNPFYSNAYHERGAAYLMLDNFDAAIKDLNKAIELGLESESLYVDRRLAYLSAIKYYSNVLASHPDNIESYMNRGTSFAMIGQSYRALEDFNSAISLNPKSSQAYYNRGLVHKNLGNIQNAHEDFQQAARLGDKKAMKYLAEKGIRW